MIEPMASHSCRHIIRIVFFILSFIGLSCFGEFEGKQSNWKGYTKTEFQVDGNPAFVVEPKTSAAGKALGVAGPFPHFSY